MTRHPRHRIWALAACVAVSAASLVSCSTFDRNDSAAAVGAASLSITALSDMATSELGMQLLGSSPFGGLIEGDTTRSLLGAWVVLTALDEAGLYLDADASAAAAAAQAQYGPLWDSAPPDLQELLIRSSMANQLLQAGNLDEATVQATVAGLDVFIDARYGRWDPLAGTVVPLG